jgi:hypothetical protein
MEASAKLIPYSVHLRPDIFKKLKEAAGNRRASSLVRDAITMIIEGDDAYTSGFNKGVSSAVTVIENDENASLIAIGGSSIGQILIEQILTLKTKTKKVTLKAYK